MTRKDRWQWVMRFAVAALALGAAPPTVDAQVVEEPWLAWIGCWVPVGGGAMDPGLCFVPASEGVVERISFTGDRIVSRQALRVDGSDSPLVIDDCEGTDALRPSADGLRFYTRSVMTCGDDEWTRAGGVMAMFTPTQWVDVRTVSQGAEPVTSAQYYQLAAEGSEARVGLPAPTPAQVDAELVAHGDHACWCEHHPDLLGQRRREMVGLSHDEKPITRRTSRPDQGAKRRSSGICIPSDFRLAGTALRLVRPTDKKHSTRYGADDGSR